MAYKTRQKGAIWQVIEASPPVDRARDLQEGSQGGKRLGHCHRLPGVEAIGRRGPDAAYRGSGRAATL